MLLSGSKSVNETKDNEMYLDLIPLKEDLIMFLLDLVHTIFLKKQ